MRIRQIGLMGLIGGLLATFPLGQLVRWEFFGGQVVLRPNDLLAGVVGGMGLISLIRQVGRKKVPLLVWPLLLWFGAVGLSLLVNLGRWDSGQMMIAAGYALRFFLYAGIYFFVRDLTSKNKSLVKSGLILIAVAVAVIGLVQYLVLPDMTFLAAQNWDNHYFRLIFPFLDPGFTGAILTLGLLVLFDKLDKFGWAMGIVYTALVLTYSRASYFMYLVGFGVIAWYKKSAKIFIIAAFILLITVPFLPPSFGEGTKLSRENSFWARINNWKQSVAVWRENPFWGVGFNAYRYALWAPAESHAGAGADSSLLLVLATTGIFGTAAYLGVLGTLGALGRKDAVFAASFLGIFVHSWFNHTLFYPFAMEWLWIILAVTD